MTKQKKRLSNVIIPLMLFALMACGVTAAQSAVDLGTAGNFVILAKSGISTTGTTTIVGDIGVSPIGSTAMSGFGLIMDSSNEFAKSSIVAGNVYAAGYTSPASTKMTVAVSDMETAYIDAAGRSNPTATELGAGNIDKMTLAPGLYKWGSEVQIPNGITLSGDSNDIWVFQIAKDLTVGNRAIITLSGGAQAENIFWQVAGQTTLGTASDFKGIILSKTAIVMKTGAKLNGRALAQTAVTLEANTVKAPGLSTTSMLTSTESSDTGSTSSGSDGSDGSDGSSGSESSSDWQCTEWSACSAKGIRTKTCTQVDGDSTSIEELPCTPIKTNTEMQANRNSPLEMNQIGQENDQASGQIRERKEKIKSGDYTDSLAQRLRVRTLAHNLTELSANGIAVQTNLNITAETDSQGRTRFTTRLRNQQEQEIKIMPDTASENALEKLRLKACSSANNCTIRLKDVGSGNAEKIQYEVQQERHSRILGIFDKKMQVSANVDAQTGATEVHKPWWAFMATETSE